MSEIGNELTRGMDTFINLTIKVKPGTDVKATINSDLDRAIPNIPDVARKLSAF